MPTKERNKKRMRNKIQPKYVDRTKKKQTFDLTI